MNLCSDNHEEICYEGRQCPACALKEEIDAWEKENTELKLRIEELEEAAAEDSLKVWYYILQHPQLETALH